MRIALVVLAVAAVAAADRFEDDLAGFESARRRVLKPGAHAEVYAALDRLVAVGDVRAVRPIARFMVDTFDLEEGALTESQRLQKIAEDARLKIDVLRKEVAFLEQKERAGDATAAQKLKGRSDAIQKQRSIYTETIHAVNRQKRVVEFLVTLRTKLLEAAVAVVKKQKGDELQEGFRALRQACDVAQREQGLFLIRAMKDCGKPEASAHLEDLLAHPKAPKPVLMQTIYALASYKTGYAAILKLIERNEDVREHGMLALSLRAGRQLEGLEEARKFVATLEE